jgi:hypothetical protein
VGLEPGEGKGKQLNPSAPGVSAQVAREELEKLLKNAAFRAVLAFNVESTL